MLAAMQISAANVLTAQQTAAPARPPSAANAATRFVPQGFEAAPPQSASASKDQHQRAEPAAVPRGLGTMVDVVV